MQGKHVQTDGAAACCAYRAISGLKEGSGRRGAIFLGVVCGWAISTICHIAPAPPRLAEQSGIFSGVPRISHRLHQHPVERRMSKRNALDYVRRQSHRLLLEIRGPETKSYRRLAAKCASRYAVGRLDSFLAPLQVGVAVPGGGETTIHASRSFVPYMKE